jgi:glycosyltransferase involved in cell wall biosynthesis
MNQKLVSVIIPTFNRVKFLEQAIESVLSQKSTCELLIVNDGSTDGTENLLKLYREKYADFRYISQVNQGVAIARNTGIKNAAGEYIIFLDDDDQLIFNGIHKLLAEISNQAENVGMVCGGLITSYEDNRPARIGNLPGNTSRNELLLRFLTSNHIALGQVIIKKQALTWAGGFSENYPFAEDYELWTKILLKYDIAYLNHPVLLHRKHAGQVTVEKRGLVRYYSDKTAFKFLQQINLKELFKPFPGRENENPGFIAENMENLARTMLNYPWTHFDTALEILKMAQDECFNNARKKYIEELEKNIPLLLKNKFAGLARLSPAEKLELKTNFL